MTRTLLFFEMLFSSVAARRGTFAAASASDSTINAWPSDLRNRCVAAIYPAPSPGLTAARAAVANLNCAAVVALALAVKLAATVARDAWSCHEAWTAAAQGAAMTATRRMATAAAAVTATRRRAVAKLRTATARRLPLSPATTGTWKIT
jgi:hypothetical protein